jgi:hypothetical protein
MIRIGIIQAITGQTIKNFDDSALRYIILAINSYQDSFQLEFVPFNHQDEFLAPLLTAELIDEPNTADMQRFYFRQRQYFEKVARSYKQKDEPPDSFQVVSAAKLRSRWYCIPSKCTSIIAMGDWERTLSPPSILEFIQMLVLYCALNVLCPKLNTHLGTRGCMMDFSANLSDARQMTLSGFICQTCRNIIADSGHCELVNDLHPILSRSWLGRSDDPTSPAGIVSKLGYNLFITKGFKPNKVEAIKTGLLQESARQISTIIGTVIAAFLLALLGYAVVSVSTNSSGSHPSPTQSPAGSPHHSSSSTSGAKP